MAIKLDKSFIISGVSLRTLKQVNRKSLNFTLVLVPVGSSGNIGAQKNLTSASLTSRLIRRPVLDLNSLARNHHRPSFWCVPDTFYQTTSVEELCYFLHWLYLSLSSDSLVLELNRTTTDHRRHPLI